VTTKNRRERERDGRRDLILRAAAEIVTEEGLDKLSIRKIAAKIEYSPAIVYHYFANKEEIVDHLLQQGYQNILRALGGAQQTSEDPAERLAQSTRNYIQMALQNPDNFKAFILSDSPAILERTAVLFKGATQQRPSVAMISKEIRELAPGHDDEWVELTAQVMWAAMFGLTVRLLIERNLPEEQRQGLIERHIGFVRSALQGLAKP